MLLIQLTGLSGAGKTSIAVSVQSWMASHVMQLNVDVVDGDVYRKTINSDLGFSKADRIENIRRLGKVASGFVAAGHVAIIAAINPYEIARAEVKQLYQAKTIWIKCGIEELRKRDTKGLYKRSMLAASDVNSVTNLTGVNDPYEVPENADLVIDTSTEDLATSASRLSSFILQHLHL